MVRPSRLLATRIDRALLYFLIPLIRGVVWRIPNVRAFNEGSPRPRVARAQETFEPFLSQLHASNNLLLILLVSPRRSGQVALYCAHRTSTVLSCAFCEQEGHLAAPSSSFSSRALREHGDRPSYPTSFFSILLYLRARTSLH